MVVEDEITSVTSSFDEESLMALKRLSKQTPTSKYEGVVDKIEVFTMEIKMTCLLHLKV